MRINTPLIPDSGERFGEACLTTAELARKVVAPGDTIHWPGPDGGTICALPGWAANANYVTSCDKLPVIADGTRLFRYQLVDPPAAEPDRNGTDVADVVNSRLTIGNVCVCRR